VRNSAFLLRSCPFMRAMATPAQSSQATPSAMADEATTSTQNLRCDGLPGGRIIPRRQASMASRWSRHTTQTSATTPATTNPVNQGSNRSQNADELSRVVIALSRADMALSKAEASLGRAEAMQIKCAAITLVALFCLLGVRSGFLIVTFRHNKGKI
jgi:hypothetical protein